MMVSLMRRFNFYVQPYAAQPGEAEVSKSRTPQPLRLFPCLQLTRCRIAESVACALSPLQDYPFL